MSLKTVEYKITTEDTHRATYVRIQNETSLRVTWPCGEARTFSIESVPTLVYSINAMAKVDSDDLIFVRDLTNYRTFVCIRDGILYADSGLFEVGETSVGVPWADLKKAIKKLLSSNEEG